MKLKLILALAILCTAGTVSAQGNYFGVKGGLNLYTMRDGDHSEYRTVPGIHAGFITHFHLHPRWAIQPEVMFSTQGSVITRVNRTSGEDVTTRTRMTYVNVPVLLQYLFYNGFRLQVGPQIGLLTSADVNAGGENSNQMGNFRKVDIAAVAGISYVHPPSGFGADLRYNFGLREVNAFHNTLRTFNQGMQVGIFYLFAH